MRRMGGGGEFLKECVLPGDFVDCWRAERVKGAKPERWLTKNKNRSPTYLQCESNRSYASVSLQEIAIMLRTLHSTESRRDGCDDGALAHRERTV